MRSGATLLVTAVLGVGSVCVTREAHALGPVDLEVAGKVGVGTNPFGSFPNPLGFGLGARAGVSLLGLYGGVGLMYYFGSQNGRSGADTISSNSFLYGIEGGYGAKLFGLVTLRGQLGLGSYTVSQSGTRGASSNSNIYLEPGLTALLTFGMLLVGVDANVLILPGISDPGASGQSGVDAAFTVHAQGGVKF